MSVPSDEFKEILIRCLMDELESLQKKNRKLKKKLGALLVTYPSRVEDVDGDVWRLSASSDLYHCDTIYLEDRSYDVLNRDFGPLVVKEP